MPPGGELLIVPIIIGAIYLGMRIITAWLKGRENARTT